MWDFLPAVLIVLILLVCLWGIVFVLKKRWPIVIRTAVLFFLLIIFNTIWTISALGLALGLGLGGGFSSANTLIKVVFYLLLFPSLVLFKIDEQILGGTFALLSNFQSLPVISTILLLSFVMLSLFLIRANFNRVPKKLRGYLIIIVVFILVESIFFLYF